MAGIGLGITFVGYSLIYYGVSQIRGGNWGLLDLVIPGRWDKAAATPKDGQTVASPGLQPLKVPLGKQAQK
jgi:hypothetical protein